MNNSYGNMARPELSYPVTARHEYSNAAETKENDLKTNFIKIIEVLKEEMKNSLNWRKEKQKLGRKKSMSLKEYA